jgi:hypothetical protein
MTIKTTFGLPDAPKATNRIKNPLAFVSTGQLLTQWVGASSAYFKGNDHGNPVAVFQIVLSKILY